MIYFWFFLKSYISNYVTCVEDKSFNLPTVIAWGQDDRGQIAIPEELDGVKAIDAGDWHSLALEKDGTVVAWGGAVNGELSVPEDLKDVEAIAAGSVHNLALKADGTVVAWGLERYGEATVPDSLSEVKAVAAGGSHSLALVRANPGDAGQ